MPSLLAFTLCAVVSISMMRGKYAEFTLFRSDVQHTPLWAYHVPLTYL